MAKTQDRKGELLKSLSKGLLYSAPLMMAMGAAPALAVSYDRVAGAPALEANERDHMVVAEAEAEGEGEAEAEAEAEGEAEGEAEAEGEGSN